MGKKKSAQQRGTASAKASATPAAPGQPNDGDIVSTIAARIEAILKPDAPVGVPPQLSSPSFAEHFAKQLGIDDESRMLLGRLGGPGALGELLSEAWTLAQARLRIGTASAAAQSTSSAASSSHGHTSTVLPASASSVDTSKPLEHYGGTDALGKAFSTVLGLNAAPGETAACIIDMLSWVNRALACLELDGQRALDLAPVLEYTLDHPMSDTALQVVKSLTCILEGGEVASNLIRRCGGSTSSVEEATVLFAESFILDDKGFQLCAHRLGIELSEAMARVATQTLSKSPNHVPALVLMSRLQRGDDMAKLRFVKSSIEALETPDNSKWRSWRARLHELCGLTLGGMGQWPEALDQYRISVQSGGGRLTQYCLAVCLNSLGRKEDALHTLNSYIMNTHDQRMDGHQLPDAMYLKGLLHMHFKDLQQGRACCEQALALESLRCPFFNEVQCAAKRSLMRMCSAFFGDASSRAAALREFREARANSQTARATCTDSSEKVFKLSDPLGQVHVAERRATRSSGSSDSNFVRINVLEFSRHPKAFKDALLDGEALLRCRESLATAGFTVEQTSGAKIFVPPDLFEATVFAIAGMDLKPWHVVTSDEHLAQVLATVRGLRSRDQVREKSREKVDVPAAVCASCRQPKPRFQCALCRSVRYCSKACQKEDALNHSMPCLPLNADETKLVSRTFIHIPVGSSSGTSGQKTASTTDADSRKGPAPRHFA